MRSGESPHLGINKLYKALRFPKSMRRSKLLKTAQITVLKLLSITLKPSLSKRIRSRVMKSPLLYEHLFTTVAVAGSFLLLGAAGLKAAGHLQPGVYRRELRISRDELNPAQEGKATDASRFLVLEFADFQCPACRDIEPRIAELRKKYYGKADFLFRHFPLSSIHPRAFKAACVAEAARQHGKFDAVRRQLLEGYIDDQGLRDTWAKAGCDVSNLDSEIAFAAKKVQSDEEIAKRLKLDQTPTFIICTPDKRVFEVASFGAVERILKS